MGFNLAFKGFMPLTIAKLQNTVSSIALFFSGHGDILKDR